MPDQSAAEVEFLRTEILTGLTLSGIALSTADAEKRDRNRANARKAYDTVLRFFPAAGLPTSQSRDIEKGLAKLKSELQRLGEDV